VTTAGFGAGRTVSATISVRPTRVSKVEAAGKPWALDLFAETVLRHHHVKNARHETGRRPGRSGSAAAFPLFVNEDVIIARCVPAKPQAEFVS